MPASAAEHEPDRSRQLPRLPALDGLRGIAVLAVVALHGSLWIGGRWADAIASGGFLGVDLFFVLSGFLITALLLGELHDRGGVAFRAFYLRRACRLFPALAALLAAYLAYAAVSEVAVRDAAKTAALIAGYVFNWAKVADVAVVEDLNHAWSLSIEEQFYLVWPVVVLGLARLGSRPMFVVVLAAAAASAVLRGWLHSTGDPAGAYYRTDARAEALLVGALVAMAWHHGILRGPFWRHAARAGAVVFAGFVLLPPRLYGGGADRTDLLFRGGLSLVALSCGAMIAAVASGAWSTSRVLNARPLRAVGRVSYGLYLWHVPVLYAMNRHTRSWPDPFRVVLAAAIVTALTVTSWYVVERPFLRLKHRYERRRAESVVPAPTAGEIAV